MKRQQILEDIVKERKRQEELHGDHEHHPAIWSLIIMEELGEVARAIQKVELGWGELDEGDDSLYDEVIQTAASLVAFAETLKK